VGPTIIGLVLLGGLATLGLLIFKSRYIYWFLYCIIIILLTYLMTLAATKIFSPYQYMRLIVFIDPDIDPRGHGWNIIQSITAIGSGGPVGKGFLQGTQSHYRYLPQQSTDFIFSIIAEETGFLGSFLIFVLYLVILIRSIMISYRSADMYGTFLSFGIIGMFAFHFLENIGMAMGIMPVTGIPLLFLSYGGSSIWTALIGIGLILSVDRAREQ
jgi:rod shape determining protein RodA